MLNDLLDTVQLGRKDGAMRNAAAAAAAPGGDAEEPTCPVDHKTRETWVRQARARPNSGASDPPPPPPPPPVPSATAAVHSPRAPESAQTQSSTWTSWIPFYSSNSEPPTARASKPPASSATTVPSSPTPNSHNPSAAAAAAAARLGTDRVISSIPRSSTPGPSQCPSNHESETGASASGNWVYPSEQQFFEAMRRKGYSAAQAADMHTVVPIHNAVNERAWREILAWEAPYARPDGCCPAGPRLHSFEGLSEKMSPRARINSLLGYAPPFDRHDWVVDRCGTRVEYVIDFYTGRAAPVAAKGRQGDAAGQKLSFYLDVRPKLNTWEGVKMRVLRGVGWV